MGVSGRRPDILSPGNKPGTHCIGVARAPRTVWIGVENLAVLRFDPRILQLVASQYTESAIPATNSQCSREL